MTDRKLQEGTGVLEHDPIAQSRDPFAGSSLVPMLIVGLVLTFAGMIAALALS
jgi:hypothetical protein